MPPLTRPALTIRRLLRARSFLRRILHFWVDWKTASRGFTLTWARGLFMFSKLEFSGLNPFGRFEPVHHHPNLFPSLQVHFFSLALVFDLISIKYPPSHSVALDSTHLSLNGGLHAHFAQHFFSLSPGAPTNSYFPLMKSLSVVASSSYSPAF